MSTRYEDALQAGLDALESGEGIEAVLQRYPEHADALREDFALGARLSQSTTPIAPPTDARARANSALHARLATERESALTTRRPWFALPALRFAAAAAVVVIAVFGAGFLIDGNDASVQAATIEGVVIENQGGVLTVQTLNGLERITVPTDVRVSDVGGLALALDAIAPGQVVVIRGERGDTSFVAVLVERNVNSIELWCANDQVRCRQLLERLQEAVRNCDRSRAACLVAKERLDALRQRAVNALRLQGLQELCNQGGDSACREVTDFCSDNVAACRFIDVQPPRESEVSPRDVTPARTPAPVTRTPARDIHPAPTATTTATPILVRPTSTPVRDNPAPTPTPATVDQRPSPTPVSDSPRQPSVDSTSQSGNYIQDRPTVEATATDHRDATPAPTAADPTPGSPIDDAAPRDSN